MSYIINLEWHDIEGQTDGMSNIQPEDVNGELSETLNDIDYFDFVVYYGQTNWAYFEPNLTFVDLWSIKQSKDVFNGRCIAVTEEMTNDGILSKRIHCESEMAYLCDSVGDVNDILLHMRTYYPATPEEKAQYGEDYVRFDRFIMSLLSLHTTSTGDVRRRIYPDNCTYNSGGYFEPIDDTGIYPMSDITQTIDIDTGSSWSVLKDLRDRLGYDIWIVHEDGHIVLKISYSGAHMDTHHTPINLGENMQSLRVETSPQEYGKVTRIVPLGGVGANGLRLTIADVNDHERWLTNAASRAIEAKTGIIQKVVVYEDLVDDGNLTADEARAIRLELMRRGSEELSKLTTGITGISCRAVDLYELNVANKYPYQIGGNYPFYCPYLGLNGDDGTYDSFFRLTKRVTDLGKPYDPELTFALPSATYRTQATDERIRVAQKIYALQKSQADRMDSTSVKKTTTSSYDPTSYNSDTVYYVDNGSSGQIYLNGKPYGGGASTTVENATVLVPTNFHDFVIEEELILDIQPPNMLYYGRDTAIVCVQGHYMLQVAADNYGAASYDSEQGWLINRSKDTYDAVIANLDKFGSQLGTETEGGFLITRRTSNATSGPAYPEEYAYLNARIVSISGYNRTNNRYSVSVDERRASTNAPTGNWWEEDMSWGSTTLYTHQQYIKAPDNNNADAVPNTLQLQALYLVPVTRPYQTAETFATTIPLQTPYGYANMQWPIIVAVFRDKSTGDLSYSLTNVDLTGTTNRYIMPLISNAEKCFALGLTKRTEPVVPNGGGT